VTNTFFFIEFNFSWNHRLTPGCRGGRTHVI